MSNMSKKIAKYFISPGNHLAFSCPGRLFSESGKLTRKQANEVAKSTFSYGLHRQYRRPKYKNPYFIYKLRQQVQMDLIDFQQLAKYNDGIKYLLLCIDSFSRRVFLEPIKNKKSGSVVLALEKILKEMKAPPQTIMSDAGSEFKNRLMYKFLRTKSIRLWHPNSEVKCGIAERANRSLQNIIFMFMTENETFRYKDELKSLLRTYNTRGHRTLQGMSPLNAEKKKNYENVLTALNSHYSKFQKKSSSMEYNIDTLVRVSKTKTNFSRGYQEQWSREIFKIIGKNTRMPITMYYIKSMDSGEKIKGGFYKNELNPIDPKDVFKIEKVLKEKVQRGKKWYFVKFSDFGEKHNKWIEAAQITNVY